MTLDDLIEFAAPEPDFTSIDEYIDEIVDFNDPYLIVAERERLLEAPLAVCTDFLIA